MAGMTVEELQVLITAQTSQFNKEIADVKNKIGDLDNTANKASKNIAGYASFIKKALIGAGIGAFFVKSTKDAMRYIDTTSMFKNTMHENADAVIEWTEQLKNSLGISRSWMRSNIAALSSMGKSMGLTSNNALTMGKSMSLLAQDMAQFYGLSPDEAFTKIQSGLTGQIVPLRSIGILLDESTVKQTAYNAGIAQQGAQLTEQQKLMARYIAILKQTGDAHGYLGQTIITPSAQLNMLKENFYTLSYTIGNIFIPVLNAILPVINAVVKVLTDLANAILKLFGITPLKDMFKGASKEASGVAGGVGDIEDGLNGATKAAKKLQKQLAGFDEMNVLKEPVDTSGGGSGGAGGGGFDFELPNYDPYKDYVNTMIDEIYNKIKSTFGKIGDFLKDVWDSEPVQKFVSAVNATLRKITPNVQKIGKNVVTLFTGVWESLTKSAAKYGAGLADSISNMLVGMWSIADPIITAIVGAWATFSQQMVDMWKRSGQAITDGWFIVSTSLFNSIASVATTLGDMFAKVMPIVQSGWESMSGFFVNFFEDYMLAITEWAPQILDGLTGLFNSIINDALIPFAELAASIWSGIWDGINNTWAKHGKSILSGIGEFVTKTIGLFQSLWDNILAPLLIPFLEGMKNAWETSLKPMIDKVFEFVAKLVEAVTAIYNNFIAPIVKFLMEKLKPAFAFIGEFIGGVFNTVVKVIGDVVGAIFGILGGLLDFITGIFTGNWGKAWDGVKQIFRNIIDGLVAILKAPINLIIDVINGFIAGLNCIKIPDWVPVVGGKGIDIPKIPKLAKGGVVDRATIAMIGENGREAVVPLENNTGWINELASAISKAGGGDQPIALTVNIGEDKILDRVIDGINDASFMRNANAISV